MKITKKEVTQEIVTIEMSLEDYEFLKEKLFRLNITIPDYLLRNNKINCDQHTKLMDLMGELTRIV